MKVARSGVREGYDLWSHTYDATPNPLIALNNRYTLDRMGPEKGELILDAACGTGRHLKALVRAGCDPIVIDLSVGMLQVARRKVLQAWIVQADLGGKSPFSRGVFDAMLCALVGEHFPNISLCSRKAFEILKPGGRLLFGVFHPELVAAGVEPNFEHLGTEHRMCPERYAVGDYLTAVEDAGFSDVNSSEFFGDPKLVSEISWAIKYLHRPLLLVVEGWRHA